MRTFPRKKPQRLNRLRLRLPSLATAAAAASMSFCLLPAVAQDATRVEKLEKENLDLKKRLEALEVVAQKSGILPSGGKSAVSALSDISLSGFVQASYFYNTRTPADGKSDGYLWNTSHNSFSINKVKMTLASKPVERSGDTWDAGFRTSLIWGEDSPVLNTGSPGAGFEALREAFVELNVPIGTGLNVKAGQLISLLNYESGDGGAANSNFSQGYQWFYTGNGPGAGIQFSYTLTDWLSVTARIQNGLYSGPVDGNGAKTFIGSLNFKPTDALWFNVLGFGRIGGIGNGGDMVNGASVLAGYKVTSAFNIGLEADYFTFEAPGSDPVLWSIGTFISYDFSEKFGIGIRAEYLDDQDGGGLRLPGLPRAAAAITGPGADGDLASVAFTLNFKPTPNIKIQPEIRYDHVSYPGGFDGTRDRVILGAGASYLF